MILHDLSHKMIFYIFGCLIWLLTLCFKLLIFYIYICIFSNLHIYNRYTIPFSISMVCSLGLLPNRNFKL